MQEADAATQAAQAVTARLRAGTRNLEVAIAVAEFEQAAASVASAELAVADTELRSPIAGTVVTRAVEPGTVVAGGTPAVVIALQDPVWIRAYAPQASLATLVPDATVEVLSDARPDRPYLGRVGYVSPQAEFTPKSARRGLEDSIYDAYK